MIGNRSATQIINAFFQKTHYVAFLGMFRVYLDVADAFSRYLFAKGCYPYKVSVKTPCGVCGIQLYSYHDMLTVNEIFCRNDYPAPPDLRIVVDLGSNIGISALYFLTRNNESRCYLFEPDPKNVPRLHNQLKGFNGRYNLSECAVADRDGLVTFGVEDTGRYGGIGIDTGKSITVTCLNINSVLEEIIGKEGIVDVLKIDTEGVEITSIKSIREDILSSIRYIYLEAYPEEDLLPGKFSQKQYGSVCQLTNIKSVAP